MSPPMTRRPIVMSTWAPPHPCSRASGKQLDGKGNLYVHADMSYGRPVYVAFFPCDESELLDERARLVKALGANDSYNMVASATELD